MAKVAQRWLGALEATVKAPVIWWKLLRFSEASLPVFDRVLWAVMATIQVIGVKWEAAIFGWPKRND